MNRRVTFSVVATLETAIKKLNSAQIPIFSCKKRGQEFIFSVNDNNTQKVFAIFSKACYNVTILNPSPLMRLKSFLALRAGLIVGAVLAICLAYLSSSYVLKVEVEGSGSYLKNEVVRILEREGLIFTRNTDYKKTTSEILSMDGVVFCNMQKRGSVLVVLIEVDEATAIPKTTKLIADRDGVVRRIVAITGTPQFKVGDIVRAGEVIIDDYFQGETERYPSSVSGYVELECFAKRECFFESEGVESERLAYQSLNIEESEILSSSLIVKPTNGGYIYIIEFSYLHRLSINLS